MPDIANLTVRYGADTSGAEQGAQKVDGLIGKLAGGAKGVAAVALGTVLGGALTTVLGGIKNIAGAAPNFDAAMSGVAASLGGVDVAGGITTKQMENLADVALDIGQNTTVGASDAAQAMDLLAKGGVTYQQIMDGAAAATVNTSVATATGLDQTAQSMAAFTSLFRSSNEQMGVSFTDMSDMVVNAMNASGMSMSEFQTGMTNMAPLITGTGMSFQESAGLISYFNNQGMAAARVGTSLTAAYTNLTAPTDTMLQQQQALGLQIYDNNGQFRGLPAILGDVQKATEGMSEADRNAAINALFGADARDVVGMALNGNTDALNEWIESMGESGSAEAAMETRMDNLKGDVENLTGTIETVSIRLGRLFTPALRAAVQGMTRFISGGMKLVDNLKLMHATGGVFLDSFIKQLPGWLQPVARGLYNLIDPLGDVKDAFQDIQKGDYGHVFKELEEAGRGFLNAIKTFGKDVEANIKDAFGKVNWGAVWDTGTDLLKAAAGGVWDLGVTAINSAVSFLGDLADMAGRGYDWLQEKLGLPPNASLPSTVTAVISTIASWAGDLVGAVGGRFKNWIGEKLGLGGGIGSGLNPFGESDAITWTQVVSATISTAVKWAGELASAVTGGARGLAGWIRNKLGVGGSNASLPISMQVAIALNTVTKWLGDLAGAITGGASDLKGWVEKKLGVKGGAITLDTINIDAPIDMGKIGTKIQQAVTGLDWPRLFNGTDSQSFGQRFGKWVGNSLDTLDASDLIGGALNLQTKIMQGVGAAVVGAFALNGIAFGMLKGAVSGFFQGLVGSVQWGNIGTQIKGKVEEQFGKALDGVKNKIQQWSDDIGQKVQGASDAISHGLDTAGAAFDSISRKVDAGKTVLAEFARGGVEKVQSALSSAASYFAPIGKAFDDLSVKVGSAKSLIVDFITQGIDKIKGIGSDFTSTLTSGLDAVIEKLQQLAGVYNTIAGILHLPQISLPGADSGSGSGGGDSDFMNILGPSGTGTGAGSAFSGMPEPAPSGAGIPDQIPTRQNKVTPQRVPPPDTSGFNAGMGQLPTITRTQTAKVPPAFMQAIQPFLQAVKTQAVAATKDWGAPTGLGGLVPITKTTGGNTVGAFQTAIQPMLPAAHDTGAGTTSFFGSAIAPITGTARDAGGGANSFFTDAIAPIVGNAGNTGTGTHGAFSGGLSPIVGTANKLGSSTSGQFSSTLAPIVPQSGAHGRNASSAFNTGISAVRQAIGIAQGAAGGVNNALASASSGAYSYGYSVGSQFAAGLSASASLVAGAAATIRSLMPSSPAKKGPLKEPISFAYIVDDLRRNMNQMRGIALGGVQDTADALRSPLGYSNVWARSGGAPAGGGDTYIIITVPTDEWQQVAADAKAGRLAHTQVSPRGRETALGLARG